ncbi:hypothetical protein [Dyella sp. 2RAB6]|uniref:hypothetical protein n=1 Tax=Dyella sp. 2RAB6 TaxID=3232992 RepID=UPI003F90AE19
MRLDGAAHKWRAMFLHGAPFSMPKIQISAHDDRHACYALPELLARRRFVEATTPFAHRDGRQLVAGDREAERTQVIQSCQPRLTARVIAAPRIPPIASSYK